VVLALGLSLLNPAFSEKSGTFKINAMIHPQIGVALLIILRSNWGLYVPMIWSVGIVFLLLGISKLSRIE
jgi:hypothetical protein